jgi:hypothetical protein
MNVGEGRGRIGHERLRRGYQDQTACLLAEGWAAANRDFRL